ncbi:hypothetical protein, partial [Microvirga aerilata]|uniref:hypothetical protein n=1 Tax=Microvirga aerilata TaxID=670292 RepID=UPI00361B102C
MSLLEETAFSGERPRGKCGVLHNGSCRCVQIGCCGIKPRIPLQQNNQACQALSEERLQFAKVGLIPAELDGFQRWRDQCQLLLNRVGEMLIRHEQLSPGQRKP